MPTNPLHGLKQLTESASHLVKLLDPKLVRRLHEAGAFDPRRALGAVETVPWLLGRGPSLGTLAQIHATSDGSKTALLDRHGQLTWAELDARANRLARALASMDLQPGDRVATILRNSREAVEAIIACQKQGYEVAPLNTWAKPKELRTILERSEPATLIYDPKHKEQVQEALGDDPEQKGAVDYETLIADQPDAQIFPFGPRGSQRILIHTSGTTGKPKAASRSANTRATLAFLQVLAVVPYRADDVIVCPAPLFHSFGLLTLSIQMAIGATIVLPEKFDPRETLELIEKHRATAVSLVPVMIRRILSLPDEEKERDVTSLRILLASGSAMSPEMRRETAEAFGDVLYDLYGSTEAGWVAIATPQDIKDDGETLGKPVPGVEVGVFDENRNRLEQGEHGELYVKSDMVFEGYASGEEAKEIDGFLSIGDMGYLDEQGRLYVEGRGDDMVVIGGENVYPAEIEEVIDAIDGVEDVAVVGMKDEEYGEVLAAFVVGHVDPENVKETAKRELASFKVPKKVEIVGELPRNSTGKILKKELVEQHEEEEVGGDGGQSKGETGGRKSEPAQGPRHTR